MGTGYQGNNSNPMDVSTNIASLKLMEAQANKAQAEADAVKPKVEAEIGLLNANTGNAIADTEQNYANLIVQNELMRMGIKLDAQKIEESKQLVEKMQNDIKISKGQLNLNEWSEEVKANYPSIFNVLGGKVDQVIRTVHLS